LGTLLSHEGRRAVAGVSKIALMTTYDTPKVENALNQQTNRKFRL